MDMLSKMDTAVPMIGNPESPDMTEAAMKWQEIETEWKQESYEI